MKFCELNALDRKVIAVATEVIQKNFDDKQWRHTVGAAVLCDSGKLYTGVNLYANCGFGPCADTVALGSAISAGERGFKSFAAVGGPDRNYRLMPPCGNCRQLFLEYAPDLDIILFHNRGPAKIKIAALLPLAYEMVFEKE